MLGVNSALNELSNSYSYRILVQLSNIDTVIEYWYRSNGDTVIE